jgi:protoporphyrinogen oxidase
MKNIAIIGGGYTGLTAAYELSQKGHRVTIFERNKDLGGLAGGFTIQGANLEKTYHHIFKTDTDIIDFVKELGIEDKLEWHDSSVCIYYDGKFYPFGGVKELLLFKPMPFIARFRTGLVMFFIQKYKNWRTLVQQSAFSWISKAAGKSSTKVIWEPLLRGKFHDQFDKVSMAWLWARLHIRANSRSNILEKEKLGYFNSGFNVITETLVKKLTEKGVEIVTEADVQKITTSPDGKAVVQVNGQSREFDNIIAPVPSHVFAKMSEGHPSITPDYVAKLNSINYLGAVCMVFSTDQDLSKYYWHNINDTSAPFLVFINHTKLVDKSNYGGKNVYYIGAYIPHEHEYFQITDEELYNKWFTHLKKLFPEFNDNQTIDRFIFRLKNAQHIVDLEYESKIPEFETPIKGVFLSNFSQIFPEDRGTNFAVRNGKRIAELVG